ncbi:IucA/IucC family protein [Paenibacillus kribbensis]|uniref:IucA/IucC family protein n=1 Tax=Paenibacillus kribbensis TaxID=172713 RepID=A0A222WPM6_9BACL|nr:IucA/IucC family protein [Paenibacillus kribbensis]ASR47711.1 IucA/IucC family protein [Paenibacillus kribbensis]
MKSTLNTNPVLSSEEATRLHRQKQAESQVMQDLVNTLLAEGFWERTDVELLSIPQWQNDYASVQAELSDLFSFKENEAADSNGDTAANGGPISLYRWWVDREQQHSILFPVHAAVVQPYRYLRSGGVCEIQRQPEGEEFHAKWLHPVTLMQRVIEECLDEEYRRQEGVGRFVQLLEQTIEQTAWSLDSGLGDDNILGISPTEAFQRLEQHSSLRDRPFHPVSKAKTGMNEQDYRKYIAEFGQDITLSWVALRKDAIMTGVGITQGPHFADTEAGATAAEAEPGIQRSYAGQQPDDLLLSSSERQLVEQEMQERGLSADYIAIPVHPWQLTHILPQHLHAEQADKVWIPLDVKAGAFQATSSVRSLSPKDGGPNYVKLPLSVFSLGASRYLPAVKLINGDRGQALLQQAKARDPQLQERLFLCDEGSWWAYMPQNGSLYDDPPRHLAAMARMYPHELIHDPAVRLIPMSALAARQHHFFREWAAERGLPDTAASVKQLFGEVCLTFFEIMLRLYRIGLMPEIHGQNCVLVWKNRKIEHILLRDHDSVRLHLPWLTEHGIADPEYQIRPGYSNSLYNETPKKLLFYLQTLGIQVNLYAIIDTLSDIYGIDEPSLWSVLRQQLENAIHHVPFKADVRREIKQMVFENPEWPLKLLVKPLLEQSGVPGSMPSGQSRIQNPFYHLNMAHAQNVDPL